MRYTHRFFDFFPPPRFLAMPAVGITISERAIRYAELLRKGDHLVLGRFGEKEIPEGAVEGGEVKDPDVLSNLLAQLKDEQKLSFARVAFLEQQAYLITLTIPRTKKAHLRGSIELQLEEHVPLPPQNVAFDYQIASYSGEDNMYVVGVSVIESRIVQTYFDVFHNAGLTPLSFEIESQANARALLRKEDKGTYMMIDIGARRTGIAIVSEGVVRFTWTIKIGGDLLTNAVSRAYGVDFQKARSIKEKIGLYQNKEKNLVPLLTPILHSLRSEISSRALYWHAHKSAATNEARPPIAEVLLCGGEANVPGILEFLATGFDAPFSCADPWGNIASPEEYIPEIPFNHSLRYVTALGLALRFPE